MLPEQQRFGGTVPLGAPVGQALTRVSIVAKMSFQTSILCFVLPCSFAYKVGLFSVHRFPMVFVLTEV